MYCCCSLANHNLEHSLGQREITPHFYVNVADIETLETELSYVACKYYSNVTNVCSNNTKCDLVLKSFKTTGGMAYEAIKGVPV